MTKRKGNCSEGKIEKSLIIIKPDAVRKKVVGEIISRFEKGGFLIEKMKMMQIDRDLATKHYSEHIFMQAMGRFWFPMTN
ncbi:MAG: nucleoside-diphosphate kinase, partial [Candidatus Humimicrobiaceae bacterium]